MKVDELIYKLEQFKRDHIDGGMYEIDTSGELPFTFYESEHNSGITREYEIRIKTRCIGNARDNFLGNSMFL